MFLEVALNKTIKVLSIGFKSGLYGGKNITIISACSKDLSLQRHGEQNNYQAPQQIWGLSHHIDACLVSDMPHKDMPLLPHKVIKYVCIYSDFSTLHCNDTINC